MNVSDLARAMAATTTADYDCRRCGACCLSAAAEPDYVELTAEEATSLRARALPVISDSTGKVRLGAEPFDGPGGASACVGFEGAPGFPCACTIYEHRPQKCREFEMGSAACRAARLRAGLPI
jgi:Fe-S-cluster containining protein